MRLTAALLAIISMTACGGSSDPTTAAYWVDKLDSDHERAEAFKKISKIGDASAVPAVIEWFEKEGEWQPDAAYTLGMIGKDNPEVPGKLIAAIDYQVGTGRDKATTRKNRTNQNVARALALLGSKEGVDPLVNLLKTQELKTREAVIRALGDIGDPKATAELSKIAKTETQPFIRKTAIQALGELGDPSAAPVLIENLYVELPGTSFYFESRYSLIQLGEGAVAKLIETLQRKNKAVEALTLSSGEKIPDGVIEAKVGFVLGALRSSKAEAPLIAALDKYYKEYASNSGSMFAGKMAAVMELCFALGTMGSKKAVPLLEKIAMDTDAKVRVSATEALTAIGSNKSVGAIMKAAKKGPAAARRPAVKAASFLGGAKDLAAYNALAKSGGKDVPAKAMKKMVANGLPRLQAAKECNEDVTCWKKKLGDGNIGVRERAAYQLGWKGGKDAIPDLLKAAEDDDNDVRMAAVSALGGINSGLDPEQLQTIHDKWKDKVSYKNANASLRRLIARLKSK